MRVVEQQDWDEFHDPQLVHWRRIRLAMEHENTLTNARMTWLLSAQGFLLGAYVLVFTATTKDDFLEPKLLESTILLYGLVIAGALVSWFLSRGIKAAYDQHNRLRDWWYKQVPITDPRHPPICGFEPEAWWVTVPYYMFPIVFLPVWAILAVVPAVQSAESVRQFVEPYVHQYGTIGTLFVVIAVISFMAGRASKKKGVV